MFAEMVVNPFLPMQEMMSLNSLPSRGDTDAQDKNTTLADYIKNNSLGMRAAHAVTCASPEDAMNSLVFKLRRLQDATIPTSQEQ